MHQDFIEPYGHQKVWTFITLVALSSFGAFIFQKNLICLLHSQPTAKGSPALQHGHHNDYACREYSEEVGLDKTFYQICDSKMWGAPQLRHSQELLFLPCRWCSYHKGRQSHCWSMPHWFSWYVCQKYKIRHFRAEKVRIQQLWAGKDNQVDNKNADLR